MEQNTSAQKDLSGSLIVFKIGILGCLPLDAFKYIAESYDDSAYIESDTVRGQLILKDQQRGITRGDHYYERANRVNDKIIDIAAPILKDGDDVFIDKFYNTQGSRVRPLDLARNLGALSVALIINTPYDVIDRRVREWIQHDVFPTPVAEWAVPPLQRVRNMKHHIQAPKHDEAIDYEFLINGNTDDDGILEQFDELYQQHGL